MAQKQPEKFLLKYLVLFGIFLFLSIFTFWGESKIDDNLIDLFFKLRGERQLSDQILFVHISDEDIQAFGSWPITRDFYGYMTYVLSEMEAKVIAFDLLFDQPDKLYPEYDRVLANFFESASNVCLPVVFGELAPAEQKGGTTFLLGKHLVAPAELFRKNLAGQGFSNLGEETTIRKMPIAISNGDSVILAFGAELARAFLGAASDFTLQQNKLSFNDQNGETPTIQFGKLAKMRLNHFGSLEKVNHIGFFDLLQAYEANPDSVRPLVANKLVLVAATSASLPVLKATPYSPAFPASLIHATLAENIIRQNYLRDFSAGAAIILILLMCAAPAWIFRTGRTNSNMLSVGLFLFGYWLIAFVLFSVFNFVMPLFYPSLALLLSTGFLSARIQSQQKRESQTEKSNLRLQIGQKIGALTATEARLAAIEKQLQIERQEKAAISEQSHKLAHERQEALAGLDRQLRDMQPHETKMPKPEQHSIRGIVHAPNSAMKKVLTLVEKVAQENIPVLVLGETGTGKELVARAIHGAGPRSKKEFVAVNCGALAENLLDSELFGHEKGSFTGAHARRRGRFELANCGTIFLDEISETTPALQVKLLRVLQEGSFERLGSEETLTVDVRVICASNIDLSQAVESGAFRADLYYRLNGFPIELPPLRERQEDIPLLARHFLAKYGYQHELAFSVQAMEQLQKYTWPGNVRELENSVRRAAILAHSENQTLVRVHDLPDEIQKNKAEPNVAYLPLEEQILSSLRALKFSRSAISQTAKSLGNRDRGTITEYFRGICFQTLVDSDFQLAKAANRVADSSDEQILARVRKKMQDYLNNLRAMLASESDFSSDEITNTSLFKGLPKQYHQNLQQVIANLDRISE